MPIFHAQINAQGKTPDGKLIPLPPNVGLQQRGPCAPVAISLAKALTAQFAQQGKALPQPVTGVALIDTGASVTCVDEEVAKQLNCPIVDVVKMSSASHAEHEQNVYPINIEISVSVSTLTPRGLWARR